MTRTAATAVTRRAPRFSRRRSAPPPTREQPQERVQLAFVRHVETRMKEFVGTRWRKNQRMPNPLGTASRGRRSRGKERREEEGLRSRTGDHPEKAGRSGSMFRAWASRDATEISDPVDLCEQIRAPPDVEARLEQSPVSGVGEERTARATRTPVDRWARSASFHPPFSRRTASQESSRTEG